MCAVGIAATLLTSRRGHMSWPGRHEFHAADAATASRPAAGAPDITREGPTAVTVEPVTAAVPKDVSPATSPPGWFAGAGDNRDHAIRSWTPDRSGYLSTVCGRPSAQAGRIVDQLCPDCDKTFVEARHFRSPWAASEAGLEGW
jgi:hypothetical protein